MAARRLVAPLAASEDAAFAVFRMHATNGIVEVRGETVEVDLGDYAHVLHREDRIAQVPWIAPTLMDPDVILRLSRFHKRARPKITENYVRRIFEDEEDREGTLFLVGVERTLRGLQLSTWFATWEQEDYIEGLRGEVIWQHEAEKPL